MSAKPGYLTTLGYAERWGINNDQTRCLSRLSDGVVGEAVTAAGARGRDRAGSAQGGNRLGIGVRQLGHAGAGAYQAAAPAATLYPGLERRFRHANFRGQLADRPCVGAAVDLRLATVILGLNDAGAEQQMTSLAELERKIRAAIRHGRRRATETDVEALLRAELIAVQAGPRPAEDPAMLVKPSPSLAGHEDVAVHLSRRVAARHIARCRALWHHLRPHELSHRRRRRHDEAQALAARPDRETRMPGHSRVTSGRFRPCRLCQYARSPISRDRRKTWCCMFFRAAWKTSRITVSTQASRSKNTPRVASSCAFAPVACSNWRGISSLGATRSKLSNRFPCASR